MWHQNRLTELLNVKYPIIQAPMAGGPTTPELVATVSNAGGLGALGAGYMTPDAMRTAIHAVRACTDKPFGVNLFIPSPTEAADADVTRMANHLQSISPFTTEAANVTAVKDDPKRFSDQLGVVLSEQVPVFSFTFGVLGEAEIKQLQQRGTVVVGTATCVLEAVILEAAGVDAIVVQGFEAGGHRGSFVGNPAGSLVGTMALVPQVVDKLHVPVIASGGIMDGRGIVASLALGASAVQMGTAFLATDESGAHKAFKHSLLHSHDTDTVLTDAFSGKLARGIRNAFINRMQDYSGGIPPYPIQNALTRPLRNWAAQESNAEYMSLWAGQSSALSRGVSAAELIRQLVAEVDIALEQLR